MDTNNVVLVGRLTRDPEIKYSQAGKAFDKFSLAVGRMKKDEVDFINCLAWEKTAEIIGEYCRKGGQVAIAGRIQTGSYDREGTKVYTTDVVVNSVQLLGTKKVEKVDDSEDSFPF